MHLRTPSDGVFQPEQVHVLSTVFKRVSTEWWFTSDPIRREEFARYILKMYVRGLVSPERLEGVCRAAAKSRFSDGTRQDPIEGRRVLLVEDDYFIARDAVESLLKLGAYVVGPAATVSDAMDIVEHSSERIDLAILDINLDGQTIYPVAGFLRIKQIPFVFVTGYPDFSIPRAFRNTPTFKKPADWRMIAGKLASSSLGAA